MSWVYRLDERAVKDLKKLDLSGSGFLVALARRTAEQRPENAAVRLALAAILPSICSSHRHHCPKRERAMTKSERDMSEQVIASSVYRDKLKRLDLS